MHSSFIYLMKVAHKTLFSGVEPTDVCLHVVSPPSCQLTNRPRRQACKASSAAQLTVGNDLSCRNPRGSCCWSSEEPGPYVLYISRVTASPYPGVFGGMVNGKFGRNCPIFHRRVSQIYMNRLHSILLVI